MTRFGIARVVLVSLLAAGTGLAQQGVARVSNDALRDEIVAHERAGWMR